MGTTTELSPRQTEILRLITQGKTDKEIAADLRITVGTVKTHLRVIFSRLRVHSRAQAAFRFAK